MSKVNLEAHDAVAVLRLNNGVTNAITFVGLKDWRERNGIGRWGQIFLYRL